MSTLRELQIKMLKDVLERNQEASYLNHSDRISAYGDGYYRRFHGVLQNYFTVLYWYVGEKRFFDIAAQYVTTRPPHDMNINHYGDDFAEFLQSINSEDLLVDIAKTQTIIHHAHLKKIEKPFDLSTVKDKTMEDWFHAKLIFQPAMITFSTKYPIHELYNAHSEKKKPQEIKERSMFYVTYPQDTHIFFEGFDKLEFALLESFKQGKELGEVLLEHEDKGVAEKLFEYFHKWQTYGLIADIQFS